MNNHAPRSSATAALVKGLLVIAIGFVMAYFGLGVMGVSPARFIKDMKALPAVVQKLMR
jgi:hypothetical protein